MNADDLLAQANQAAEVFGLSFVDAGDDANVFKMTRIRAAVNGRGVVVEFTMSDSDPVRYRYNATVRDAETGEMIATGNGGEDWNEALSIVHWQAIGPHFEKA